MKILIDECLPAALKGNLIAIGHESQTVRQAGLGSKKNGEFLTLAEGRWEVLLTSDRNIKHQQNMTGRSVSIPILCAKTNRMKDFEWSRSGLCSQMAEQTMPIVASYHRARLSKLTRNRWQKRDLHPVAYWERG